MIFGVQSMDWSTFVAQWNVLAMRNLVLRRRNYRQLIIAYLIPVIAGCYILFQYNQPYNKPSELIGVDYDLPLIYQNQSLKGVSKNFHLCVAPRDIEESFLNSIQESLSLYGQKRIVRISQFEDDDHLKERMLKIKKHNEPDCDAGVTIVGNISTSGTYIVHVTDDRCSPVLDKYCSYGIQSNIQQAVDNAFLQEWTGNSNFKQPSSKIHSFIRLHEGARDTMYGVIKLLLLISYFPIFTIVTENLNKEKCLKIKESMFVMGTKPSSYWLAWLFGEMALFTPMVLTVTIALFIASVSSFEAIILHFVLWFGLGCTFVVCAMTLMRFCLIPQIANVLALYIFVTSWTLDYLIPNESDGGIRNIDYFAMLASPVAYGIGFNKIIRKNDFCGGATAIVMIFFDFFLYSLLDFTLEYLFPYGITPPWGKLKPNGKNSESTKCEDAKEKEALIGSPSTNLDPWITLEKIRKAYSWFFKPHIVLDEVSFTIFKGEVTCLLGQNEAGKSTLMKIISGALTPDEGRITTATSLNFGVCPQENILHDDLTTYEHLHYFGSLKGIPYMKLHLMVTTLLESFDLFNKKDTKSKMLSLGQKRMLCVAIAMIGDPKVLLLDEPSSGMSPQFRRQLWKILQDYTKSGRSVLFATHDTDEAELFADRIVLLYYGKLIYYGTTMDIKKQFGGGYNVRITLQSEPSLLLKSELVSLIKDFPSKPEMILKSDCEIVIKLHSFDATTCSDFLRKIEEQFKDLGSDCFTVSVSSLEEIFFLLADKNTKWTTEKKKTAIPKFTYISSTWTNIKELIRARCRVILCRFYMLFPIIVCIILISSDRCVSRLTKEIFNASPKFYENEIIQVINASEKPFTDFEKSLSKLRMKFESVNSTVSVGKKSAIVTEIQNYNLFNETLEVNWNWTTYYKSPFALPILQNLMSNVLWKTFDDKFGRELKIIVQPIRIIGQNSRFFGSGTSFTAVLNSVFLMFVAIVLGIEVLKEKERKIIWLFSTTRNNALPYWISTFVVQLAIFSISLFMLQTLMLIYGVHVFQNISLWITFYLCLPGCLLTVYLMAQWLKIYQTAEVLMLCSVIAVSLTIFSASVYAVFEDIPYVYTLNTLVLFLFPIYAPFGLVILLSEDKTVESVTNGTHWKIVCGLLIPLSNLFYVLLIVYLEKWKTFLRKKKIQVMNQEAWDKVHNPKSIVDLKSVRKAYTSRNCLLEKKKQVTIKDVSMSFLEGEIFALMGSKGAGKSTLMKLLSLNTGLTSGEISIREKYMESIAYCPEKNTIWFELTVEEQLRLFAILNGVPVKYADQVVDNVMKDLLLKNVANTKTGWLSVGYQRKVSIAMCLLGNSNLVLLDEPTTGMDPIDKHFVWKLLHREFPATSKRTLILTIESSNEAEVNSSRIGIFSDGNIRTLGTTEALKKQFNKGFQLNITMKNEDNKMKSYLKSEIPEAMEKFHKGVMLQYYIPRQAFNSMSGLFTAVAKIQAFEEVQNCLISEYPLNQIIREILSQADKQVTGEDEYAI